MQLRSLLDCLNHPLGIVSDAVHATKVVANSDLEERTGLVPSADEAFPHLLDFHHRALGLHINTQRHALDSVDVDGVLSPFILPLIFYQSRLTRACHI